MSESTNSKHRETLNSLFGHEKTHNLDASKQLIKRIQIPNTPFQIIGEDERGYFIAFGMKRITEIFTVQGQTEDTDIITAALDILDEQHWHITCTLQLIMCEGYEELKKLKEQ